MTTEQQNRNFLDVFYAANADGTLLAAEGPIADAVKDIEDGPELYQRLAQAIRLGRLAVEARVAAQPQPVIQGLTDDMFQYLNTAFQQLFPVDTGRPIFQTLAGEHTKLSSQVEGMSADDEAKLIDFVTPFLMGRHLIRFGKVNILTRDSEPFTEFTRRYSTYVRPGDRAATTAA